MESNEITLADVRRLRVNPGDTLLVTVPAGALDLAAYADLRAGFEQALPGTRVLVVDNDIDVAVVEA